MIVSIGTGYFEESTTSQSMGWDVLMNHLIASSTDTEDVDKLLQDFLPPDKYFRFNPVLSGNLAIDEKNKSVLLELKNVAKQAFKRIEKSPTESRSFNVMINTLKGNVR